MAGRRVGCGLESFSWTTRHTIGIQWRSEVLAVAELDRRVSHPRDHLQHFSRLEEGAEDAGGVGGQRMRKFLAVGVAAFPANL